MTSKPHDTSTYSWQIQRHILARMDSEARLLTAIDLSEFTAAAAAPVENPVELPDEDPTGAPFEDHEGHDHEGHSH